MGPVVAALEKLRHTGWVRTILDDIVRESISKNKTVNTTVVGYDGQCFSSQHSKVEAGGRLSLRPAWSTLVSSRMYRETLYCRAVVAHVFNPSAQVCVCNPSPWEVEVRDSGVQGYPCYKISSKPMGCMRPCLRNGFSTVNRESSVCGF